MNINTEPLYMNKRKCIQSKLIREL
jgi:hypothetical protein